MKRIVFLIFCSLFCLLAAQEADSLRKAALGGEAESMLKLADEYFHGTPSRHADRTVAAYWYRKAAEAGVPEGMYNLGVCLLKGEGTDRNLHEAVEWFRKAADAGVKMARLHVAGVTITGLPADPAHKHAAVAPMPEYGLTLLKALAEEEFVPAELEYARFLLQRNKPEELPDAVRVLTRMTARKDPPPEALRMLADCKYGGLGTKPDPDGMIALLRRAAKSGDAEALGKLAFCYEYGRAVSPDMPKAVNLYRLAAERGNAKSQYKYAEFLAAGAAAGGKPDLLSALPWYRRAAEQGNVQALFRMGEFRLDGIGFEKDEHEASRLFFLAAKEGYAPAQHALARMYETGRGDLIKDDSAAVYWLTQAAQKGEPSAQCELGLRYLEGRGVTRSLTRGEEWLQRAVRGGDYKALRILRLRGLAAPRP